MQGFQSVVLPLSVLGLAVGGADRLHSQGRGGGKEERIRTLEERVGRLEKSEGSSPSILRVLWKDGLRFESPDRKVRLRLGGRIQNDWAWMTEDAGVRAKAGPQVDGTEFRRARLYLSGKLPGKVFFKTQFDFAGGDADFKDVYLGMEGIPFVGRVQVGHFKEPFSLEELTSSKYITFLERGLPNVFAPGRNTGIAAHDQVLSGRMTWAAGIFRPTGSFGDGQGEGESAVTARVTGLPWFEEGGKRLLHLGFGVSVRNPSGGILRYRQRPEVHLASRLVDTGTLAVDRAELYSLEGALVLGPFSVQSEYIRSEVKGAGDPGFSGIYGSAGFFFTGEHRPYKTSKGVFGHVKPRKSFGEGGGLGAWEAALRYSDLDLQDGSVAGGRLSSLSLGLNWYLNPNTRLMFNYVLADLEGAGDFEALAVRFQVHF